MDVSRRALPLVLLGLVAAARRGAAAPSWDGTWAGGWEGGDGVQIVITGNKVIAVFRGGDYPDIERSELSADGTALNFAWARGDGRLQRTGEREAAFTLHERGRAERKFPVRRE